MNQICETCKNYQFLTEVDGKIAHRCEFCQKVTTMEENALVFEVVYKTNTNYESKLNPYLKYDPTLPRYTNLKCPNKDCSSHKKNGPMNECVAQLVEPAAQKFLYQCVHCSSSWTN